MGDRPNNLPNTPAPEVPPVEQVAVEYPEPNPPPALALAEPSEVRDCGKLIQSLKERGILQMSCFVILLLFNKMQMSLRRFSAIPHLRGRTGPRAWGRTFMN